MERNLYDFLNGDSEKLLTHKTNYKYSNSYTYFIKISSRIKDIKLIYEISTDVEDVFPLFEKMNFIGIFYKPNKTFYYSCFPNYYREDIDCSNLNVLNIGELAKELEEEIKSSIISKVGYDENSLKTRLNEDEMKETTEFVVQKKAFELFMKNEKVNKYEYVDFFSLPQIEYSGTLLVLYLGNPNKVIEDKVNEFLNNSDKSLYKNIIINKLVEKELEKMNKDKSLHEKRKIAAILSDTSRKTLNLEFEKNEKTLECKIETSSRYLTQDSIWSMSISFPS